ncbi:MAG: transcriptional regulator [Nocardioides sp.]
MDVEQVKTWVATSMVMAVVMLHAVAVAALGAFGPDKGGARVGLFVIASLLSVLAIGAARLIHKKPVLTPWLLAGPVPPLLVYWVVLGL